MKFLLTLCTFFIAISYSNSQVSDEIKVLIKEHKVINSQLSRFYNPNSSKINIVDKKGTLLTSLSPQSEEQTNSETLVIKRNKLKSKNSFKVRKLKLIYEGDYKIKASYISNDTSSQDSEAKQNILKCNYWVSKKGIKQSTAFSFQFPRD